MKVYLSRTKVDLAEGPGPPDQYPETVTGVRAQARQSLDGGKSNVSEAPRTLSRNEQLLSRFLASRRLRLGTREGYRDALLSFSRLAGAPLEGAGRDELEEWYHEADGLGLAASSILLYAGRLRKLLEFAGLGRGLSRVRAQAMAMLALEGVPREDLRREVKLYERWLDKLLTIGELGGLVREARHPRTRAFIPVAYEMGCRKGELLGARIRDVTIGRGYSTIRVWGKTGQRTLPLVRSVPALEAWLDVHPDPRASAPIFATAKKGQVSRLHKKTPNRLLKRVSRRAGLRHLYPNQLRHTRLTELAAAGVGEYVLKSFAGWTPDSKMAARYIHFSGRTHIPAILRLEGVDVDASRRGGSVGVADVYGVLERVLEEAEGRW